MVTYKVVAPYVTLKVKDMTGTPVIQGYYAGAVVDAVDEAQAQAQADLGFLEKVAPAPEPEPAEPEGDAVAKPHGNAGRDAWVTYALESRQASEDEVKDLSRDELRELYG
jgi:hypothetical protein